MTLEEWVSEHGTVIVGTWKKYEIGDLIQAVDQSTGDGPVRTIRHPFRVVRLATREEFVEQMRHFMDVRKLMSWRDYYYEVSTD